MMNTKKCPCCGEEKSKSCFGRNKTAKDGLQYKCKKCMHIYYLKNKSKLIEYSTLYAINHKQDKINYNIEWKNRNPDYKKEYDAKNKLKNKAYRKEYRLKHTGRENARRKHRLENDLIFKFKHNVRNNIKNSFKRKNWKKNTITTAILGCSIEFFIDYIGNLFVDGMTWDNHGEFGWHLDHIVPLATAVTEDDIIKLCHYTNYQPLWAEANWSKGAKF